MTRHQCLNCGHRFDFDDEAGESLRCPECMRKNNIEPIKTGEVEGGPKWVTPVGLLAVAALIAGGWWYFSKRAPAPVTGEVPSAPLSLSDLRGHLRNLGGEPEGLAELLIASDTVEEFAEEATAGANGAQAKAKAIHDAIRARARAGAFVQWPLAQPRDSGLKLPAEVLMALKQDGSNEKLYPLELAAFAVAAMRSVDVPAMVVEVASYPEQRSPLDPSGYLGYFGAGAWDSEVGSGDPTVYDLFAGREVQPAADARRVLTDVQAVGAALGARSIRSLVHESDQTKAFTESGNALKLDAKSPMIHGVRGAVLIASGGLDEGVREYEAAAQLRADGPRSNNLAGLYLAQQDMERAGREVTVALDGSPEFAAARVTLAAVHLSKGETDDAGRELAEAERLDPTLPKLPMMFAQWHLANREPERAAQRARQAVERQPQDWQTRLQAARIYRAAARYDDMRREAHKVVELSPPARSAEIRRLIESMLGPTALEPIDDTLEDDEGLDEPAAEQGAGGLTLRSGSSLLEEGADEEGLQLGGGGGLLGEELDTGGLQLGGGAAGGGLQLGGGGGGLQLGGGGLNLREPGGGGGLRLNLNE